MMYNCLQKILKFTGILAKSSKTNCRETKSLTFSITIFRIRIEEFHSYCLLLLFHNYERRNYTVTTF